MKTHRILVALVCLQAILLCTPGHAAGAKARRDQPKERPVQRRPQEPARPYPYREEKIRFPGGKAGLTLAGTLTLPPSGGPFPAVILINGSGPFDRDEPVWGHRPFLVLADCFTRRGMAVLRYDKRGIGQSGGDYETATVLEFAADARAALAYLKGRKDIGPGRIGLIGHSEGGMIAPMVAAGSSDVAFIVMMAGTCVPMDEVAHSQWREIGKEDGASDKEVAGQLAVLDRVLAVIKKEEDHQRALTAVRTIIMGSRESTGWSQDEARSKTKAVGTSWIGPWFRFYLTYDPRPTLTKVKCPVLALFGGKDKLVDPKDNLPAVQKALTAAGNPASLVREMPGLNHLLQHAVTGDFEECEQTRETISPEVLALMSDWIAARIAAK